MNELIKRLERVIQTGVPDKDGMHPISAEAVLEVVNELSEHGTNLAEVGTDCISRQAVFDALRTCYDTETITMDNGDEYIHYGDAVGEIEQLPPIHPVNNSEMPNSSDVISRQAAIKATWQDTGYTDPFNVMTAIRDRIEQLPPIQPKRGKWHYSDGKPAKIGLSFGVVCDQCGTESEYCTNFCGECGADMRGEQDDSI